LGPHGFTQVGYTAWGFEDAERTVVCMHGLTRNGRDFDFLAQRLAALAMRVVAPDLPGRGRSAPVARAEDYGTPLYLAVAGALIAHLGVKEVDWVGTSLGGHIGMELAAQPGSPSALGAQRLRCTRACCRIAAHRQLSAEHPDLSHADRSAKRTCARSMHLSAR
jgi:pimeloyl-ACP methyl ester carboxylesterase